MPSAIPSPVQEAAPPEAGGNGCKPFPREISWEAINDIEMELHSMAMRVKAVEIIGRGATDSVHGDNLTDVFGFLAEDMSGDIERIKELLGLGKEVRS